MVKDRVLDELVRDVEDDNPRKRVIMKKRGEDFKNFLCGAEAAMRILEGSNGVDSIMEAPEDEFIDLYHKLVVEGEDMYDVGGDN